MSALRTGYSYAFTFPANSWVTFPWDDHAGVGYWRSIDRLSTVGGLYGIALGSQYLNATYPGVYQQDGGDPYTLHAANPTPPDFAQTLDSGHASSFYPGQTWGSAYNNAATTLGVLRGSLAPRPSYMAFATMNGTSRSWTAATDSDTDPTVLAVTLTHTFRSNTGNYTYARVDHSNVVQWVFFRNGDLEINVGQIQWDCGTVTRPYVGGNEIVAGAMGVLCARMLPMQVVLPPVALDGGMDPVWSAATSYPATATDGSPIFSTGYEPHWTSAAPGLTATADPSWRTPPANVQLSTTSTVAVHDALFGAPPQMVEVSAPAAVDSITQTKVFDENAIADLGVYTDGGSAPLVTSSFNSTVPGRYFFRGWKLLWELPPPPPPVATTEPHLRLSQRNDGLGTARHPRLSASAGAPSSVQRQAAPRLGSNDRYR